MRIPTGDEVRYLVYTTLAYGAQGISYYVYCCPGHKGVIALADGTPTPLYHALKSVNREFAAIAGELQPLRSLGVYHAGMTPPGAEPLGKDVPFRLDPPVPPMPYKAPERVKGILLGLFGPAGKDHGAGQGHARAGRESRLQGQGLPGRSSARGSWKSSTPPRHVVGRGGEGRHAQFAAGRRETRAIAAVGGKKVVAPWPRVHHATVIPGTATG